MEPRDDRDRGGYPFIGIGWRQTLRLTFARTRRFEPVERAAIGREGVVRIEEGVRTRVTMRGPGKIRINKPRLTLVLTRERLLLYTRWRRSVDVRFDDPDWGRVTLAVDEEGRLRLIVPRGVGGGVHVGFEMDVRLSVDNAKRWVRDVNELGGTT